VSTLQPYCSGTNLWRCPRDAHQTRRYSFALNDYLLPAPHADAPDYSKLTQVPSPTLTLWLAECADGYVSNDHFHFSEANDGDYTPPGFAAQVASQRHLTAANYLFVDGHAQLRKWSLVLAELNSPGSRFVNPAGKP
jgi:prepilin-type processing-associated H-X9-DG protein